MKRQYPYKKRYKKYYLNEWGSKIPRYNKQPIDFHCQLVVYYI